MQVPENTPDVEVGSLIAIMVEEGQDWKNVKVPASATVSAAPAAKPKETSAPAESAKPAKDTKAHGGRTTK